MAGYAGDRIRIGSLYSLSSGTVPAVVMGLKLRKPDIQTELVLGSDSDLLRKLRDGAIDASIMGRPEDAPDVETLVLFEDEIFFAAPAASPHAEEAEVDLSACSGDRFVSLTEGFVTHGGFLQAFRVAGYDPDVVMRTGDIFSLMNLVSGGIGCTLLPGRVRPVLPPNVKLVRLQERFRVMQQIAVCFLRTRERDPNLLALLTACRGLRLRPA
jgi:LysR family malonate utilization transcriptional regulator